MSTTIAAPPKGQTKLLPSASRHIRTARDNARTVALEATQRRLQAGEQYQTRSLQDRMGTLVSLGEENRRLRLELEYSHRLMSVGRKLLGEVQFASGRLRKAVLDFRNEEKIIHEEFLKVTAI